MEPNSTHQEPATRSARFTIQHLMLAVLLVGVILGVSLNLPQNPDPKAWKDRLLSFHLLLIGFIIPQCTFLFYTLFAAPMVNPAAKKERTAQAVVLGCLVETFAVGSLFFWVIVMSMVRD